MSLDLTPMAHAVARLREGLSRYEKDITDEQIRDGLIQRFERTYVLSHKTLKRFLEQTSASPDAFDAMAFPDLIRTGNEQGLLLSDWPAWRRFREMRAQTSHTYDTKVALEVVAGISSFLEEAEYLCAELRRRAP